MREKNPNQITRVDGKNTFLEVMRDAFTIQKVHINFIEYDPNKNNQQTKKIETYIDFDKFLFLIESILKGGLVAKAKAENALLQERINKALQEKQDTKYIYAKEVFVDMGGISSKSLPRKIEAWKKKHPDKPMFNFEIPQGKCISRQFKITPGMKKPWVLSGEQGIGDDNNKTGLIVPVPTGNDKMYRPKEIVRVPFESHDDLKKFALICKAHIEGFISATYVDYVNKYNEYQKSRNQL